MLTRRGFLKASALSAAMAGAAALSGCDSTTVGTSTNDSNVVFSSDEDRYDLNGAPAVNETGLARIELAEQGWWAKDGYVHWGVVLSNANAGAIARDTILDISLFDANDVVIHQDQATVAFIGPECEIGFAGTSGDGLAPDHALVSVASTSWWQDAEGYREPVSIETAEEQDKLYFRYEITGQVKNWTTEDVVCAPLSVLLRGEDGGILAGYTGAAYRIKPERSKDYLVTVHSAPEHASFDLYAQPCESTAATDASSTKDQES